MDKSTISNSTEKESHEYHHKITSAAAITHLSSESDPTFRKHAKWNQIFAALAATTSAVGLGCVFAYTATALPDLRMKKPFGQITSSQETWIGPLALPCSALLQGIFSIFQLGGTFACPVAGFLVDGFGRRKTILWLMPLFLGGWMFIALAQNMEMIYAGRFITGFSGGAVNLAIPVFLTEVSDVEIRGALTSCLDMMVTVGILYIYLIGTYANWQIQALACGAVPVLCFFLMLFIPESPRFLLERNEVESARKALAWFQDLAGKDELEKAFSELVGSVDESREKSGAWKDILEPTILKPISIGLALMVLQQGSGILPITAYTVDIFHSAGTTINDNLSTNIVGVIQVVATITSALFVDRCGRRLLLILSQSFMAISMSGMGAYFFLKNHNDPQNPFRLDDLSWLPLTCLLIFVVAFSIGIGPICWVYMGEILPSKFKGKGSGIITLTSWLLSFFMTLGFGDLIRAVGEDGGYWIFGGVSFLGFFFVYFCVPETKGKSLDEIQSHFNVNS